MWEAPDRLWQRLRLGREEYLQRLLTTLIVDGAPPSWNSPCQPGPRGLAFLHRLDQLAHGSDGAGSAVEGAQFVDEFLLPKLEEESQNGWPDWAVLWPDRVWIIELKTERGSHRDDQLPYYLRLAAAAHPEAQLDLTYITGPLEKPEPELAPGQRYRHLTWAEVLPLVEDVWGDDPRPEVAAYVEMVRTVIDNIAVMYPSAQRVAVISRLQDEVDVAAEESSVSAPEEEPGRLLELARLTASDGQQRGVGVATPTELEQLRDLVREEMRALAVDDPVRRVHPWIWDVETSGGRALTPEGEEFGHELRFSRYRTAQV